MVQYTWYFDEHDGIEICKFNADQNRTGIIASFGSIFNTEEEVRHDIAQYINNIKVRDIRK